MKTVDVAVEAEKKIHNILHPDFRFEMGEARMYGLTLNGDEITEVEFIDSHADVYELLYSGDRSVVKKYDFIALATTGWAAPLNEDGDVDCAPSRHEQRRRVRLVVTANREGVASVIRFADQPNDDSVVTDENEAVGSLADAINNFIK